jgi:molybdopterin synthase catalytic subunit
MFQLTPDPIDIVALRNSLIDPACGAFVAFEGRVRNHHHGADVLRLEYEVYSKLAIKEGNRILESLRTEFALTDIRCMHRYGALQVGEIAVWVAAISAHREESFAAVSKAMTQIKQRVPIWKREYYADGSEAWVHCSHGHKADKVLA